MAGLFAVMVYVPTDQDAATTGLRVRARVRQRCGGFA
jgi:hypothetical protein